MVFTYLKDLLTNQYACDEDEVEMTSRLDDLNLSEDDLSEIMLDLTENYGVEISESQIEEFITVEDIVACVEDQM
jgi:acyl carrier protein